ncbi:hypothetical protein ACSFB8_04290 [Enterococcus faecalis]
MMSEKAKITVNVKTNVLELEKLLKQAEKQSEQLYRALEKIKKFELEVEVQS